MATKMVEFGFKLEKITSPATLKRIVNAAGMGAKKASLEAAVKDLGGDRSFSGFSRRIPLGVGFDARGASAVEVNYRPAGLWRLAESGRRSSGVIRPKKKRAVLTPGGPRASSRYGPSRGLGTFSDAVDRARKEAPKAAADQFHSELVKIGF